MNASTTPGSESTSHESQRHYETPNGSSKRWLWATLALVTAFLVGYVVGARGLGAQRMHAAMAEFVADSARIASEKAEVANLGATSALFLAHEEFVSGGATAGRFFDRVGGQIPTADSLQGPVLTAILARRDGVMGLIGSASTVAFYQMADVYAQYRSLAGETLRFQAPTGVPR